MYSWARYVLLYEELVVCFLCHGSNIENFFEKEVFESGNLHNKRPALHFGGSNPPPSNTLAMLNANDFTLSKSGKYYFATTAKFDETTGDMTDAEKVFVAAGTTLGRAIANFQKKNS